MRLRNFKLEFRFRFINYRILNFLAKENFLNELKTVFKKLSKRSMSPKFSGPKISTKIPEDTKDSLVIALRKRLETIRLAKNSESLESINSPSENQWDP